MKRMVCEMCGGTDLVKQDGVFVCQSCGTKYSVEEARKMMVEIEGTVEVTGTVKVDNSAAIENYLKMARNAMDASNNEEAESYANKIIELEPQNSEAWEIKGEAAGWQSTTNNNRMAESVTAWLNAIKYASADDVQALRERIADKYSKLFLAMITLRGQNFGKLHDNDRVTGMNSDLNNGVSMMNTLTIEGGVSFNRAVIYELIAKQMNEGAIAGYRDAKGDFGPEHRNMAKWQWNRFTASCDNCIKVLERAGQLTRGREQGKTIYNNMVTIGEAARDSKSWKFNVNSWHADNYDEDYSFTDSAKNARTKSINTYKEERRRFESDLSASVMSRLEIRRKDEETQAGIQKYWEEHQEEKGRLEDEQSKLQERIAAIEGQIANLTVQGEIQTATKERADADDQISRRLAQLGSLGMFKGKEKRALQEQIDALRVQRKAKEEEIERLRETAAEQIKPLEDEKAAAQSKIKEIREEFEKSRGQLSVTGKFTMDEAIKDGHFNISVEQLIRHLEKIMPEQYVIGEPKKVGFDLHESLKDTWQFMIKDKSKKDKDGNPETTGVVIYADSKEVADPIKTLIINTAISFTEDNLSRFCMLSSYLLLSLCPELSLAEAEKMICDMMISNINSRFEKGAMMAEYADHNISVLGLMNLHFHDILIRPKQ